MPKIWNVESPVMKKFAMLTNLVCLNLLWIVFSLPVITIGASTTALYSTLFSYHKDETDAIFMPFLLAFKRSLKQSTLLWLLICIVAAVLFGDAVYIMSKNNSTYNVVWIPVGLAAFLTGMAGSYGFPQIALFDNKLRTMIRNGYHLAILNLIPSMAILVVNILPWAMLLIMPQFFFASLPFWIMCGFSLSAYLNSYLLLKIFQKYMRKNE